MKERTAVVTSIPEAVETIESMKKEGWMLKMSSTVQMGNGRTMLIFVEKDKEFDVTLQT